MDEFIQLINALSPILCALIGIISYATLTNYRLDSLDKQVSKLNEIEKEVNRLDKRVSILENKSIAK